MSGGSVQLPVRSSPPLILYEPGKHRCPPGCDGHYHHSSGLSCGSTALVTPPCHAFVVCTPASLSLVCPGLCLPSRPRLPRLAFLASRGGSKALLTPPRFPRRLLPCRLSTWTCGAQPESQWQAAMDAEMASWKSTGTYVDEAPPPGANIVSGMWIFRLKWLTGSPPVFKVRYVARGFSQRQGVEFFHTFSPTPKMTTLWVLLHVVAQRDYELHLLKFSTAFLQGSLHEEIWLRRPPGFTRSFPTGTQWSLRRPVYGLRQAPRKWHATLRTTLAALGFAPSTSDPSLFLRTDTTLPPFYVLMYVDNFVIATADTEALAHVKSELQKRHTCTDLGELTSYPGLRITRDRAQHTITLTQSHMVHQVLQRFGFTYSSPQSTPLPTGHSLSAPPSDESVEPSGPCPELVCCLMYLMTCTRRDLSYPLSLLARYVAPVRRAWGSCLEDGLELSSLVTQTLLGSICEAESYAGAMAAQELRWLTYLLTNLGEAPHSPPVLYVDNKAMLALCQVHRLEHRTKHIALRYFLARELQQRGQLRLAYVLEVLDSSGNLVANRLSCCSSFVRGLFGEAALVRVLVLEVLEATSLGVVEPASTGAAPTKALHTFTLDSGASRCFFRDCTVVTPLTTPVPVTLADPSGGLVVARTSTVLPCLTTPCGSLAGLHLPSFTTNLVSNVVLQDQFVTVTTPGGELVAICTDSQTGAHLATFMRRPGSGMYTVTTKSTWVVVSGQRVAPHSSFPPTTARLHNLYINVWGPARVSGPDCERYFLLVIDDYMRNTRVFPLPSKDLSVLRLHSDRDGKLSSHLFEAFFCEESIAQTFTFPASPQQNGVADCRIGLIMEDACTSMIHMAAPHFLWLFAVRYAAHQLNLWPRVSVSETSPTRRWTGEVGDAWAYCV
ncbi:unnamed protein product [Closterium sp. NIES-53]